MIVCSEPTVILTCRDDVKMQRWWNEESAKCPESAAVSGQYSDSERRTLLYRISENISLYGIFDVHNGDDAPDGIIQNIFAEILSNRPDENHTDEEIKEILRNSFVSAEKLYVESVKDLVLEKTNMSHDPPEEKNRDKFDKFYGNVSDKLKRIDKCLSTGITAVMALVFYEKLFVVNIGDGRALLCKTDDNCVLRVVQLSVDHNLRNEDELLRLSRLGLDIDSLRKVERLGNLYCTRCLGNYLVKGFYHSFNDLSAATGEPIVAIPEVHGPIILDESCRFLILVSDEIYKNLQDSMETGQVNKQFAQIVVEQFRIQSSMESVCRAVIEKTINLYTEHCSRTLKTPRKNSRNSLLIKNFNFPLLNCSLAKSPIAMKKSSHVSGKTDAHEGRVRFNPIIQSRSPMATADESDFENYTNGSSDISCVDSNSNKEDNLESTMTSQFSQSSDFSGGTLSTYSNSVNRICDNKRIPAYVDFSQFYQNVELAKINGTLPSNIKFD